MTSHHRSYMAVDDCLCERVTRRGCRSPQTTAGADGYEERRCGSPREDTPRRSGSGRLRQHSRPQAVGSRVIRCRPHEPAQGLTLRDAPAAGGALAEMDTGGRSGRCIELTIKVGVQVTLNVLTAHRTISIGTVSFSTAIRRSRARASRDITVPSGTPTIAAISL